tara:strand:- start:7184 stop:8257 length:1074 start_codon:yes stop_codon:yes gene_type:complete
MNKKNFNLSHLKSLRRERIPENRDLKKGLRLNRNERVSPWPKNYLKNIIKNKPGYFLSIYPDLSSLYEKISKHNDVDPSKILVTSGIDGAMKTIWEVYTKPGDRVGVPSPTYAMYYVYSKIYKTKISEIPYDYDTLKLNRKKLKKFIDSKPKILFLPNPNQPVDDTFCLNEIRDIAVKTKKHNTLFVVDEAYLYFGAESAISLIDDFSNIVIMRTFSKGFGMPSIRLGFMASSEENMEIFNKTRFAHETSSLSAAVGEYALDNFEIIKKYNERVIASREKLKKIITDLGYRNLGNFGNYLFIDLKNKKNYEKLTFELQKNKIYVKSNYPKPWNNFILITLGPTREMSKFTNLLTDIL